ncbi:monooxygenase [bacterium]|nr:monooxygenase [bacterium]
MVAALCMQRAGWQVAVLEQAPQRREIGAGIQISPNAMRVLAQLGLQAALGEVAKAPEAIELRLGSSGKTIFSIALQANAERRWGAPYWHVYRPDLLKVLDTALHARAPDAFYSGWQVNTISSTEERVHVTATDGRKIYGDVLIGADGVHSTVREHLFGIDAPRYTGNMAWRAVVPTAQLRNPPPPTACIWTGRGRHAVTYQLRGGALSNFVGVVEQAQWGDESWTQAGTREQALADFSSFHPLIGDLLTQADAHYRWALLDRQPLPTWHEGRTVLLGDACHPMLPFLAQGAAQAIEDAWVLANCLAHKHRDQTSVERSFADYTKLRLPRTTRVQAESRANQRRFHQPDLAYWPLAIAARLAPKAMLARNDWLFGHDVTQAG